MNMLKRFSLLVLLFVVFKNKVSAMCFINAFEYKYLLYGGKQSKINVSNCQFPVGESFPGDFKSYFEKIIVLKKHSQGIEDADLYLYGGFIKGKNQVTIKVINDFIYTTNNKMIPKKVFLNLKEVIKNARTVINNFLSVYLKDNKENFIGLEIRNTLSYWIITKCEPKYSSFYLNESVRKLSCDLEQDQRIEKVKKANKRKKSCDLSDVVLYKNAVREI